MKSTLFEAGRALTLATLLATGGSALAPLVVDGPAFAQNGGGSGGGGGGGAGGAGDGAGGGSSVADIVGVVNSDAAKARGKGGAALGVHTHVPGSNYPPQAQYTSTDNGYQVCGRVRIVRDINGDPMRYMCVTR